MFGDQLAVYLCELPRFVKEEDRPLNPVEEWFDLLQNMTKFVGRPKSVNKRFDSILEDCKQNRLDAMEQEQYFNAMISEHEEQSIAAAYKEEGFREGLEQGLEKGLEQGIEKGEDNKAKEIARKMLSRGMSIPDIAELTGLEPPVIEYII